MSGPGRRRCAPRGIGVRREREGPWIAQLTGPAARNKGMAIFPRRIGGRYVALSRWDRESNAIVTSLDCRSWGAATTLQSPERPWELLQIGNCGSPLETPDGWLVFTHGVGPMRVYSIGAILLDLEDPTRVRARLPVPLMAPERDGYVPTSSTPAVRSFIATRWCCPTASATRRSA